MNTSSTASRTGISGRGDTASGRWTLPTAVGLLAAVACSLFVLVQMRPGLLLADTTPAGGDMGAHVWGPAFLRDHLLPAGRLTGWTPDWYAGFPAYQFYMVVPSLAIVALNAGLRPLVGIPVALLVVAGAVYLTRSARFAGPVGPGPGGLAARLARHRTAVPVVAAMAAVLIVGLPYGVSFKLVSVAGLVAFPVLAWAMARLARAPEPIPPFAALAATFFLFDTNFTITGGNIGSTLAGEFAFSISLALTLLAIGLVARGMDTGRGRGVGAAVIGLVALTHIIPVFFMIVALIALVFLSTRVARMWPVAVAVGLSMVPLAMAEGRSTLMAVISVVVALVVLLALIAIEPDVRARARWLLVAGPVGMAISAFWLLPFVAREPYFNDMGWERLNEYAPKMFTMPMRIALPVAFIGALLSLATRERIGLVFSTTAVVAAAAVINLPAGALWNERLLPFYYLSIYMVAAVGVALVARYAASAISEDYARPNPRTLALATTAGLLVTIIAVSVPLRVLPFTSVQADGTHRWLVFTSNARSFLPSWTAWNYSGYERKPAYREYHEVVTTMGRIGEENGCGRAMWEYSKDLERYGTPMALMLLPHWTDGCIGSMEGLYFESSATTPFHFLNQSTLSDAPSRAQRDLPYQGFDIARGIDQLQVTGVRYYMAQSDEAITAARESDRLTEVGEAQPFVIFEVAGADLVEGLAVEPVVTSGQSEAEAGEAATRFDVDWVGQAVRYYNNPDGFDALPAEDGPADWERVTTLLPTDGEPVDAAVVTDIESSTSSISFRVDQVGKPVLVKASYFPNWQASGADGPWRAGPNLMVVVPTSNEVELTYGRSWIEWLANLITLGGLGAVVALTRRDRRGDPAPQGQGPYVGHGPHADGGDDGFRGALDDHDRFPALIGAERPVDAERSWGHHGAGVANGAGVADGGQIPAREETSDGAGIRVPEPERLLVRRRVRRSTRPGPGDGSVPGTDTDPRTPHPGTLEPGAGPDHGAGWSGGTNLSGDGWDEDPGTDDAGVGGGEPGYGRPAGRVLPEPSEGDPRPS